MKLRHSCSAAVLLAFCLAGADGATPEKDPYSGYQGNDLSFSALKMGLADRVNDIRADGVNRVWFAAGGQQAGVAAIAGESLAQFFPLTTTDGLLGPTVEAVAFGPLDKQENFFLGFNITAKGIQYGRMLSDTGLSPKPPSQLLSPVDAENIVLGLASDGATNLWAATQVGLVWWSIGGTTPARHEPEEILNKGDVITLVAADPWTAADPNLVFADQSDDTLYVLPSGATSPRAVFASLPNVRGLAFDGHRNLWVIAGKNLETKTIYRFAEGNPADPYRSAPTSFSFDGSFGDVLNLAVDPLNPAGTIVWVGIALVPEHGTKLGAYFQRFDESTGRFVGGWTLANTASTDANVRVYVDPSGNVWFGSDFGVRSLLSRLLTLNGTRFVGYGARADVSLIDVNPDPANPVVYVVKAGGSISSPELTLPTTKNPDGTFTASFGFAATTSQEQGKLGVTSSAADVAFEVVYAFGPESARQELPRARFTWANVAPFEDDAWIGNACFLKSLGY